MKLEVGMYVRTPLGISKYLGKAVSEDYITREKEVTDFDEFDQLDEELWSGDVPNWVWECDIEDVVLKASHNIIDLIEEGDIINYEETINNNVFETINETVSLYLLNKFEEDKCDYKIKSIVTKEQFESMSYKVEE